MFATTMLIQALSRGLLLMQMTKGVSMAAISLVCLDTFSLVYVLRSVGLLVKYTGWEALLGSLARVVLGLGCSLLLRYSPLASKSYDASVDSMPRAALLIPAAILSLVFNRVAMVVEICHQCSWYLEPLALIPQFLVMLRRKNYASWVHAFTLLAGLEGVVENWPILMLGYGGYKSDAYRFVPAMVQCCVLVVGVLLLLFKHFTAKEEAVERSAFDEEKLEWRGNGPSTGASKS